jgi:hypothetical protein
VAVDDLAKADPIPRVVAWLNDHPAVTSALGGANRVSAVNEPPYPRLRISDVGGDDRDLTWLIATDVQIEAYGDLDGAPGREELRRILYVALGALVELPEQPVALTDVVVSRVQSLRAGGFIAEPTGQPRYLSVVRIMSHAPIA